MHGLIAPAALVIREAAATDEAAWRHLWRDYLVFYRHDAPAAVTDATWRRILDPASSIFARVAEQDGRLVGFAVCVVQDGTWELTPLCYLEDLFVEEAARGAGVGRAMIEHLLGLARARGWSRLHWRTAADNAPARALYDRFVRAMDVVIYEINLG